MQPDDKTTIVARLRARGTPLDLEAAEWIEGLSRSIDRAAAIIPEQTPAMIAAAEALKQDALDRSYMPGTRSRK